MCIFIQSMNGSQDMLLDFPWKFEQENVVTDTC